MSVKVIKTETDYESALERIETLFKAKPGTPEGDELEVLVTLVEMYETKAFPISMPDPISAIRFRMDQQNLKAKDLIPYIGSASKVSEVLNGKRSLSLAMIRSLVSGLGIPAAVLLKEQGAELPPDDAIKQGKHFPVAEMLKRGWFADFKGSVSEAKGQLEDLLAAFVGPLGSNALMPALNRQHVRNGGKHDEHALTAWRIRVASLAIREKLPSYRSATVTTEFLRELARLSYLNRGPLLAKEFLNKNGIHVVIERHLPKTHLDGAALKLPDSSPVVALTLRHDRLDNFWFTLFHELAHVTLHLDKDNVDAFFDDLSDGTAKDKCEQEADQLASDALIPESAWKKARLNDRSLQSDVLTFAEMLRISPSIPAGRIRHDSKRYDILKPLIGSGKVRVLFGVQGD